MPWDVSDVERHKHGLSAEAKRQWVAVANSVYEKCIADGGDDKTCAPKAIRQANGVAGNEEVLQLHSIQIDRLNTRHEMHQGRRHIVAPVTMMTEGVHNGSHGRIFHSAQELGRFPAAWNGIPVTIQHPEIDGSSVSANQPGIIDGQTVGRVYNTRLDGDRLRAEIWVDEEKIKTLSPQAFSAIRDGKPLEVSVGVFSDEEDTPGTWHDEEYVAIARNHRPDHLALLPGGVGACSWADGCGIRNNKETMPVEEEAKMDKLEETPGKQEEKQETADLSACSEESELPTDIEDLKKMTRESINDLPDSAFAYIEPGGTKDKDGKTTPRSLRHFPVHDAAHARNALARMGQSPFGAKARKKILAACKKFGVEVSDNSNNNDKEGGVVTDLIQTFKDLGNEGYTVMQINADQGYRELMSKIQSQLDAMDNQTKVHFLVEAYDGAIVYEVRRRETMESSLFRQTMESSLFRQTYEVSDNGTVTLTGSPVTVTRKVEYVTNEQTNSGQSDQGGVTTMAEATAKKPCCPGKVELLIQSKHSPYEEIDREWLSGLEEGQVDRLVATDAALIAAAKKAEEQPQINREQATNELKDILKNPDQFMALLPQELAEQMRFGMQAHREKRQKMIQALVAANPKRFTEDNLKSRTMDALEELVSLIPEEKPDYSANAAGGMPIAGYAGAPEDILLPAGVVIKQ